VIWSKGHDDGFFLYIESCHQDNNTYFHGNYTYGHPHIHKISGIFYDIRARETAIHVQRRINRNESVDFDDFLHPIFKFYSHCTQQGKEHIIVAIMMMHLRIKLSISLTNIVFFYRMSYREFFRFIQAKMF